MKFEGVVWRHIPAGAHPLNLGYILKASGRWNRPGVYACLYTSLTSEGAIAEFQKYLTRSAIRYENINPREIVSIKVSIEPVLDLTDERNPYVDINDSFLTGDEPEDIERCRTIADAARSGGYSGLLVPSAALNGEKNLVIFFDGLPENLGLEMGPDRIPI